MNRWIVGEVGRTAERVTAEIEAYRFNEAAGALYQFAWGTFCDWYLEAIKPVLLGPDGAEKDETRAAAAWVLDTLLALLHPIMPFLTEELWQELGSRGQRALGHLAVARAWPGVVGRRGRGRDGLGDPARGPGAYGTGRDERTGGHTGPRRPHRRLGRERRADEPPPAR